MRVDGHQQRQGYVLLTDKGRRRGRHSAWYLLPRWHSGDQSACQCGRSLVGKIPWRRKGQPTLVLLPGKSHGHRSLPGCSPWGHKESDRTEHTHTHTHTHTREDRACLLPKLTTVPPGLSVGLPRYPVTM